MTDASSKSTVFWNMLEHLLTFTEPECTESPSALDLNIWREGCTRLDIHEYLSLARNSMKEWSSNIIEIGMPGKFDDVFGLVCEHRRTGHHPRHVYVVVWKGDGSRVKAVPGFYSPIKAEAFVKKHRNRIIEENVDKILLVDP